jgi:hypothetical protein
VVVGHVELVGLAFVVVAPLGDRIDGEGLSLEEIALVLLVLQDSEDGAAVPVAGFVFSRSSVRIRKAAPKREFTDAAMASVFYWLC